VFGDKLVPNQNVALFFDHDELHAGTLVLAHELAISDD
jgi:hypothetical protein